MATTETTGRTVEDAVARALTELGLRRDQVDVVVVTEGKSGGFLGFGAEPARVRVTPLPSVEPASVSRETSEARPTRNEDSEEDEGERGSRPRRRRGRRGGRGRRRGEGATAAAGAEAEAGADEGNGAPVASNEDEGTAESPALGQRERGGRSRGRRGGRSRSGNGGSSSRGRGGREREERGPVVMIEGVSDDDAIPVPGTPEELPYSPIEDPADDVDLAGSTLRDILTLLGYVDTQITARDPETPGDGVGLIEQIFDIYGDNDDASDELGVLIGRRGETLSAVQYLVNTIVSKGGNKPPVFGVDIEGYRHRREEMLVDLARDIAQEVRETGDVITLEPMPAHERRIVHIALREEEGVRTESVGSGDNRQVEILPED